MAAYLIVDVDDLLHQLHAKGLRVNVQELAVGLRANAAFAAGITNHDRLKAVAVADWEGATRTMADASMDMRLVFQGAGYDTFVLPNRDQIADALIVNYFAFDPEPVDELILVTTSQQLIPLVRRVTTTRNARVRVWGSHNVLAGTLFADGVIYQPLEAMLGIQSKNVALYVDFENISIGLSRQGYIVNLEHLIDRFVSQAKQHGQVVKMAAYAPWGGRGSLPPLMDGQGREITEEAPMRLARANIDPVFHLQGKNSADVRIASDVIRDSGHNDAADVYILASGDRDFNDVLNALLARGKTVIVWGVRGATSRQIQRNPGVNLEYIEDFTTLQPHQALGALTANGPENTEFMPSAWSSVILQYDRLTLEPPAAAPSARQLIEQLMRVNAVVSRSRGEDLVQQATALGLLRPEPPDRLVLVDQHPIVERTRLVRDRIVLRVKNTLRIRDWEYVNYGFLLNGLEQDTDLRRVGMNTSDQWRSSWIDCLVREHVLARELVPHRVNPDDLVPVIKLRPDYNPPLPGEVPPPAPPQPVDWSMVSLEALGLQEADTAAMVRRIVVSVEQFTSYRNFAWCPLGSLHRRQRDHDTGAAFQRAVEYLQAQGAALVDEYPNPQSTFNTKGISVLADNPVVAMVLAERDAFIVRLLMLYEANALISEASLRTTLPLDVTAPNDALWLSIMEVENVLNPVATRPGHYNLFRTHHSVVRVAERRPDRPLSADMPSDAPPTL